MKNKLNNEDGVISLFVIFVILFLLIITIMIFVMSKNKLVINNEVKKDIEQLYSKALDHSEKLEYASSTDVIEIFNINELNIVGTGSYLKRNNKIYQCGLGMNYLLKDNIIVDIKEDILKGTTRCNDYKLFSEFYNIDKAGFGIEYYYNNSYYKLVAYQRFTKDKDPKTIGQANIYEENNYCNLTNYKDIVNNNYLLLYNNDVTKHYEEIKITDVALSNISNLNQLKIYTNNINKISKQTGVYYLFIEINNKNK